MHESEKADVNDMHRFESMSGQHNNIIRVGNKHRANSTQESNRSIPPGLQVHNKRLTIESEFPYLKVKRCLNAALFCTKMARISEKVRVYGTSCLQYDLLFKNREFVMKKLKGYVVASDLPKKPWYVVHPENKFFLAWTLIGFLFVVYAVTLMPYFMIFYDIQAINRLESFMGYYFLVDIAVNFFTAYESADRE